MDIGLSSALQHNWSPASLLAEVLAEGAEVLCRCCSCREECTRLSLKDPRIVAVY